MGAAVHIADAEDALIMVEAEGDMKGMSIIVMEVRMVVVDMEVGEEDTPFDIPVVGREEQGVGCIMVAVVIVLVVEVVREAIIMVTIMDLNIIVEVIINMDHGMEDMEEVIVSLVADDILNPEISPSIHIN